MMRLLRLTAVIALSSVVTPAGISAQFTGLQQWTVGAGANNHWYAITLTPSDWRVAESAAIGAGGHLASITSAEENQWVYDNFVGFGTCAPVWCLPATFYIGLERTSSGGAFAWMSGEALGFSAWNVGEPNDENGVEMVAHMFRKDGQVLWNDIAYNSNPMVAVIEWDERPTGIVPEPATMTLLATGLAGIGAARRRKDKTDAALLKARAG